MIHTQEIKRRCAAVPSCLHTSTTMSGSGSRRTRTPKRQSERQEVASASQRYLVSKATEVSKDGTLEHDGAEEIVFSGAHLKRRPPTANDKAAEKKQRINPPAGEEPQVR